MIVVDSNVPMYLIGAAHPRKTDAQRLLERSITRNERLLTDTELPQEILRRHVAIRRRDAVQPAFDALLAVVEILAITERDLRRAREIVLGASSVPARDALHLASVEQHRIGTIQSFDRGFDGFPGTTRLHE